jgi:hypothetical protein
VYSIFLNDGKIFIYEVDLVKWLIGLTRFDPVST